MLSTKISHRSLPPVGFELWILVMKGDGASHYTDMFIHVHTYSYMYTNDINVCKNYEYVYIILGQSQCNQRDGDI